MQFPRSEAVPARPPRRRANAVAVGVLALALAFVGAVQFRSQAAVERSLVGQDNTSLAFLIDDLHKANDELAVEQSTIAIRRDTLKSGNTAVAGAQLADEIRRLQVVLGAVPVRGPGVVVTIDAPLQVLDLQDALNNLRVGGAEAIDLNGHRVLTTTVLRPVSGGVSFDGASTRSPYTFTVVGNAARLAVVADVMTRSLHSDPRVRSAAYETATDVSIRSTAAQRPFVYGGS